MNDRSSIVGNEIDRAECEAFLTSRGHGVLSMGVENRGYGVPISFGYDEEDSRIILEFVSTPDSKKQTSAKNSEEVTVTVYNYESVDSWESVIVTGTIHPMDADEVSERFASLFFAQADDAAGERQRRGWLAPDGDRLVPDGCGPRTRPALQLAGVRRQSERGRAKRPSGGGLPRSSDRRSRELRHPGL